VADWDLYGNGKELKVVVVDGDGVGFNNGVLGSSGELNIIPLVLYRVNHKKSYDSLLRHASLTADSI
jgi:hypothetical protein